MKALLVALSLAAVLSALPLLAQSRAPEQSAVVFEGTIRDLAGKPRTRELAKDSRFNVFVVATVAGRDSEPWTRKDARGEFDPQTGKYKVSLEPLQPGYGYVELTFTATPPGKYKRAVVQYLAHRNQKVDVVMPVAEAPPAPQAPEFHDFDYESFAEPFYHLLPEYDPYCEF